MTEITTIREDALGADHKSKSDTAATNTSKAERVIIPYTTQDEKKYPIYYQVYLYEEDDGEGKSLTVEDNYVFSAVFDVGEPYDARQDAFIYMLGLTCMVENEFKLRGYKFNTSEMITTKEVVNLIKYRIIITLRNTKTNEEFNVYDHTSPVDCLEDDLFNLEREYLMYKSMGFGTCHTERILSSGKIFHCMNAYGGFVEFNANEYYR